MKKAKSIDIKLEKTQLRDIVVKSIVNTLKRFKEWEDEQITKVDVTVNAVKNDSELICDVTIPDADMDTKYLLCNVLIGTLYTHGYMNSEFEVMFPDKLHAEICLANKTDAPKIPNILDDVKL